MKNLKNFKTISIFAFSLLLISCSKSDEPVAVTPINTIAPVQDPLNGFLEVSGLNQKNDIYLNNIDREVGFSFIPIVNGKITAILVKIPDTRTALKVTIWSKTNPSIIRSETIDITSSGVETTKIISPINLIKDTEYVISMNSNDYYVRSRTNGSNITYPFIVGDIKVTDALERNGADQIIPITRSLNIYAGDCSFKFQK